ncbi:MAG: glycosyltransferase [Candidatus Electrothrix sp. EH2]|nr:glycosyltransferase [Candidatus Electrothrix sp. EH2]
MRKDIVIIASEQFGYNTATYYYCKYLCDKYHIIYIGWDHGLERINIKGVQIEYLSRKGGRALRLVNLIYTIFHYTSSKDTIIIIKYYWIISSIIRLLRYRNVILLDIRTASVAPNVIIRYVQDIILKFECKFFNNIGVISELLAKRLKISDRAVILPLGAEIISYNNKKNNQLKLLYVGTLYNRNINQMVNGFIKFEKKYRTVIQMRLTIIGTGSKNEEINIKKLITRAGLNKKINLLGRVPHNQLKKYFDAHNIGVAFIPMTRYYDTQPATKIFEYLLSGIAVIATATSENKKVINRLNGVLIQDTADDFFDGLKNITERISDYNSEQIRKDALIYRWNNIVKNLSDYLIEITN